MIRDPTSYYARHRDEWLAYQRDYNARHPDYLRDYAERHRDKHSVPVGEWQAIRAGHSPPPPDWMLPPGPPLGTLCPECGRVPLRLGKPAWLELHHDHSTGNFEGWMCHGCNMAPHRKELYKKPAGKVDPSPRKRRLRRDEYLEKLQASGDPERVARLILKRARRSRAASRAKPLGRARDFSLDDSGHAVI